MTENGMSELFCICCHANNWKSYLSLPRFLFGTKAKIFICRKCGCGITVPQPQVNIGHYEQNDDYMTLFSINNEIYELFAEQTLKILENIPVKNKTLLDVGCGGGFLVNLAVEKGFKAKGVESNHKVVKWANDRGIPVRQGNIFFPPLSKGEQYGVIVLSAVLEHLDDPAKLLLIYKDFLSSDGVVFISQANYQGLLPRFFPWGWYGWQPKEHYWHFTPKSMNRLVENAGYKCIASRKYSLYHPWFTKGKAIELIGRNIAATIARIGIFLKCEDGFNMLLMRNES